MRGRWFKSSLLHHPIYEVRPRTCARMVELFDAHAVSFVAVTQQFNTTTSMGRLTLNVLLSFAQFELEVIGERIRDKGRGLQAQRHLDGRYAAAGLRRA